MITPNEILNDSFANIIEQEDAKLRLANSVASAANDGEMASPLMLADAGCGKTGLAKAYGKGLEKYAGADVLYFASPQEFRSKGEAFSSLLTVLHDSPKYCVIIDEAHLFRESETIQTKKILAFCMKALDKNQQGGEIRLDDEITVNFNRKRGSIVLATNFPHKLSKDGALQSRCDVLQLAHYTPKGLQKILAYMAREKGLKISAKDAASIAKCGRGTARPMEKIVGELAMMDSANGWGGEVASEAITQALKLTKQFPGGLTADEIRLLEICDGAAVKLVNLASMFPHLEKATLRNSLGYLQNVPVTGKDGEIEFRPFICQPTGGFQTSDIGRRYLQTIAKQGFPTSAKYVAKVEKAD